MLTLNKEIINKISRLIKKYKKILIAGGGLHTELLLKHFPELKRKTVAILTNKINKQFIQGIPVIYDFEYNKFKWDKIIISSHSYELFIYGKLLSYGIEDKKIELLYNSKIKVKYNKYLKWIISFRNKDVRNNFLKEFSYYFGLKHNLGYPKVLEIELTNICPFKCIMCPRTYKMDRKQGFMDFELYKKIINQIVPDYQKDFIDDIPEIILIHYGESFLHPKLFDFIKYAKDKALFVSISGSASSLRDENGILKLLESGVDRVRFMLNSIEDKNLKNIMGKTADLEKNIKLIYKTIEKKKKLRMNKPEIHISMIMVPENRKKWDKFKEMFKDEDVRVYLGYFSKFNGSIKEINLLHKKLIETSNEQLLDDKRRFQKLSKYRCFFPWHSVSILWDGRVVPCCRDYNGDYVLGDLNTKTLKQIWNGKKAKALREEMVKGEIKNNLCKFCSEYNWELNDLLINFPINNRTKILFKRN